MMNLSKDNYHTFKLFRDKYRQKILRCLTYVNAINSCNSVKYFDINPAAFDVSFIRRIRKISEFENIHNDFFVSDIPYAVKANGWFYDTKFNVLLDRKRTVIRESVNTSLIVRKYYKDERERSEDINIKGPATILRTRGSNFYHTMIDNLPRLYLLEKFLESCAEPIKLLIPEPINSVEATWIKVLLPKNVEVRLLSSQETMVRVDDMVYLSPFTRRFIGALPMEYVQYLRKKAYSFFDCKPDQGRRIFISRVPAPERNVRYILNEDELFEKLAPLGFERHVLEDLDVSDQIRLFRSAQIVVGAHGAGLSNLIFSENATVVELFPCDFIVPHFFFLAKSLGLNYYCLFSDGKNRNATNFHVDINAVEQVIKKKLCRIK